MDHLLSDPREKVAGLRPLQVPPSGTHLVVVFRASRSVNNPTNRHTILALQVEI
jgi:hypothetical protein